MTAHKTIEFDQSKAEAFLGTMITALNHSALTLMASVGHRTGLFDVMAKTQETSVKGLAAASGLNERYVREWLGAMVTSGVVTYEPFTKTYTLPPEHAAFLTRGSDINLAVAAQFTAVAGGVEDRIVEAFCTGKGVHYHHYGRFHEVMAETTDETVVAPLFDHILPLAPEVITRLNRGIEVADVGCGAGRALLALAERFPNSRFRGYDLCADAFEMTAKRAREKALTNLSFEARDLSETKRLGLFDLIFAFDAVHDQKDPAGLLATVHASLHPLGVFLMQDIGGSSYLENNIAHPLGAHLYMMSCMHCTPVSLAQGGVGLGTMWGVELAERMLREAGFKVDLHRLPHDPVNAYFVCRSDNEFN